MNGSSRFGLFAALSLLILGLSMECAAARRSKKTAHGRDRREEELESCLSTVLNRTNCSSTDFSELDEDSMLHIRAVTSNGSELHDSSTNKSSLLKACTNLSASYCSELQFYPICQLAGYPQQIHAEKIRIELHSSHDEEEEDEEDEEEEEEDEEEEDDKEKDDDEDIIICEAAFSSRLNTTAVPFLSNVSTTGSDLFPYCQLVLEGYFPPCCGKSTPSPSLGNTHTLFISANNVSFNATYHSNGTNCSKILVPYQNELHNAILDAANGSLQLRIEFTDGYTLNYTANAADLLCYTICNIPLPVELVSAISMVDSPCMSVNFVISYSNESLLIPANSTHISLGDIFCYTSINQTVHELVANCSVTPFADIRNLTVYTSSNLLPTCRDLKIANHSKMEAANRNQCVCSVNNIEACIHLCTSNLTDYTDFNVLLQCEQLAKLLLTDDIFGNSSFKGIDTIIRILDYYTGGIESNLTLESAVHIYGYLIPSLNETYTNVPFTDNITQEIALITDSLLADQSLWSTVDQSTAADLLGYLELFGLVTVAAIANNSSYVGNNYNYYGSHFSFKIDEISSYFSSDEWYTFPSVESVNATSFISIPSSRLCSTSKECRSHVVSFSAENFHLQLAANSSTYNQTERVGSSLVSSQIFYETALNYNTNDDIQLTFFTNENGTNYSCVFWDYFLNNGTGGWSTEGLTLVAVDKLEHRVVCNSSHLTSFAVLVIVSNNTQFTPEEEIALSAITYIGCVVSAFFLVITIVVLLACKKPLNKGSLLYIHLNFCISLLLAQVVFLSGIQTAVPIRWLCGVVAGVLHYLFLCVFCWMLVEGIMLYLLVVKVFSKAADKWYFFVLLGWALPLPIVVITAVLGSVRDDLCWLSIENGFIWAFAGPVIAVFSVNFTILILTLWELAKSKRRRNQKFTQILWMNAKSTVILLPLLGLTWVFGLFTISANTTVFAWLFTIFNSIQGLFIFLFHILRNDQVLAWLKLSTKNRLTPSRKKIRIPSSSSDLSVHSEETISQQLDGDDIKNFHSDYVAASV